MIKRVSLDEIERALPKALAKLQRIIDREGDDGGERLKEYYLKELIMEQIKEERAGCNEKRSAANANAPEHNFIVSQFQEKSKEVAYVQ